MKTNRLYNTIIDLEYFCHQDLDKKREELHQRDRNILLQNQKNLDSEDKQTNRDLINLWLSERIHDEFGGSGQKSPGSIFGDIHLLARNISTIKGIIVGLLAGIGFFSYSGINPVNVFHFLLLFVASQLVCVSILFVTWLLRLFWPKLRLPSFYSLLLRGILNRLVTLFHKGWMRKVSGKNRTSVSHAFGIFKARSALYGSLFYWPLFGLFQLFTIGFNVGLLVASLVKILTSDIAFGWQSTLQFSAEAIHSFVMFAALPWSWFVPETVSYPSITEIEGSRIILKEGIYHLATADLIAWWPFLVLCLVFYGLLLRLALFVIGKILERNAFKKIQFDTPGCRAIIDRMLTPLVSTQANPEPRTLQPETKGKPIALSHTPSTRILSRQVVLIPDDIFTHCPITELGSLLQERAFTIADTHRFMVSYEEDQQLKELLATKDWQQIEGLLIIMEGWMVPLVAFLSYLKELRLILPKNTTISLGLVGRPSKIALTPVAPSDFIIWLKKIEAIGDPYLFLFSLISSGENI